MANCRIVNPDPSSIGLPFPLRGILGPGRSVVVNATVDEVLAAFGGESYKGAIRLEHTDESGDSYITGGAAGDGGDVTASDVSVVDAGHLYTAGNVEAALAEVKTIADAAAVKTDLASTSHSKGASLIGIEDSGGKIAATTVEAALAEAFGKFIAGIKLSPLVGADASGGPVEITCPLAVAGMKVQQVLDFNDGSDLTGRFEAVITTTGKIVQLTGDLSALTQGMAVFST